MKAFVVTHEKLKELPFWSAKTLSDNATDAILKFLACEGSGYMSLGWTAAVQAGYEVVLVDVTLERKAGS